MSGVPRDEVCWRVAIMFAQFAILILLLLFTQRVFSQNETVYNQTQVEQDFLQTGYPPCLVRAPSTQWTKANTTQLPCALDILNATGCPYIQAGAECLCTKANVVVTTALKCTANFAPIDLTVRSFYARINVVLLNLARCF